MTTTTTEHDWRDVLLRAASIVEDGWCQGAFHTYRDTGEIVQSCAAGAISRAACYAGVNGMPYPDMPLEHSARIELAQHLRSKSVSFATIATTIEAWNDHPDRTVVEVAEAMRQAAT